MFLHFSENFDRKQSEMSLMSGDVSDVSETSETSLDCFCDFDQKPSEMSLMSLETSLLRHLVLCIFFKFLTKKQSEMSSETSLETSLDVSDVFLETKFLRCLQRHQKLFLVKIFSLRCL